MIRSLLIGVNSLTVRNLNAYDHLISNGPCIQNVRWKRKPMWLPTAKSKIFRVPVRPVIPIEDQLELKRLHNNYRTLVKSLNHFFIESEKEKAKLLEESVVKENVEEDFKTCMQLNNVWNEATAQLRSRRIAAERENRIDEINQKLELKKERDTKIQETVDLEIRKAKEESSTFITSSNIDEAIQNALQNVVNRNIAIDTDGNVYEELCKISAPSHVTI